MRGSWLARLVRVCWERPRLCIVILVSSIFTIALAAAAPVVTRSAVNDAVAGHLGRLGWMAALLVTIAAIDFAGNYIRRNVAGQLSLWVQHTLRGRVFDSIQRLDGRGQDALRTGEVVSRTNSDLQQLHTMLQMCPVPLSVLTYYMVATGVMLWLSPALTVIVLLVLAGIGLTAWRARTRVFAASARVSDDLAELTERVRGVVTQVDVVKSFAAEQREIDWLEGRARRLYGRRVAAARAQARPGTTLLAMPLLGQVAVLTLGGWAVLEGRIDLGTFVAFAAFLAMLTGPTRVLASFIVIAQRTKPSVERVFGLIDAEPTIEDGTDDVPTGRARLEFDRVTFGYDPERPILDDVSFSITAGETVAVVGASGSGKSTLSLLLPRFYAPDSGSITLTDQRRDIADLRLASLRREVGVVFEDTFLFAGTIADNVSYGHPDASREEIVAAAEAAGASGFIGALAEAYETRIGDGATDLSGGQRQRLALARALLTRPTVLVVDDATSALDATTEAEVNQALRGYAGGDRILVTIARRRSTLELADRIIVLDRGRVADTGTYDELIARSTAFRDLLGGAGDSLEVDDDLWPTSPEPATAYEDDEDEPLPPAAVEAVRSQSGRRVTDLVRPVALLFGLALGLIALDAAATIAVPVVLQRGIDDGVLSDSVIAVLIAAGVALALIAVSWTAYLFQTIVSTRAAEAVQYAIRVRSLDQLLRLPLRHHEQHGGDSLTRLTVDVDALARFLQAGLANGVMSLLTIAGITIAMAVLDLRLALVALASMPLILIATLFYRRFSSQAYAQARHEIGKVNRSLQEKVSGLRVTQAHGRQEQESRDFSDLSEQHRRARSRAQRLVALYFPFVTFCAEAAYAVVLFAGAHLVADESVTPGVLTAFLLLVGQLYGPIQQLSNIIDSYQQATVSTRRIDELLSETQTEELDTGAEAAVLRGDLDLSHVTFRYAPEAPAALDRLTLTVPAGTTTAVVGTSGAGKSTLVKVLAGLYSPDAGQVRVGEADLGDLPPTSRRRRVGVVAQDVTLFDTDVAENIRYAAPDAPDEQVEEAARATGARPAIATLPAGFRTQVTGGGKSLSAGQRQLIALARAELADPDLLVLDEATARLDPQAEESVLDALIRRHRTAVIVAHRLTTAARCDQIVVMEAGRVVESGSHRELLQADTIYARMWRDAGLDTTPRERNDIGHHQPAHP